jgi:cell division protein FtsB
MSGLQKVGVLTALTLCGVYVYVALRGPQGLPAVEERWTEIRDLQKRNADLKRDVDSRSDRIRQLQDSPSEQELEIRRRLKMLRKGETTFIIAPGGAATGDSPKPAPAK